MPTGRSAEVVDSVWEGDGRILNSPLHRRILAWAFTLVAVGLLLWNVPVPWVREQYQEATSRAYQLAHLDQSWTMFAPEVSRESLFVHIEVVYRGGAVEVIEFPDGDPWIGTFRAYRWSAYEDTLPFNESFGDAALAWALDQAAEPSAVERVEVIGRRADPPTRAFVPFEPEYRSEMLWTLEP